MTDYKKRDYYNVEALRALVLFVMLMFLIAVCVDVGYYNAKRYGLEEGLAVAVATGVEGLPNPQLARDLTSNVANSQGIPLHSYDVMVDPGHKWLQVDMRDYYDTMFLGYVGIKRIPFNVHVFDF